MLYFKMLCTLEMRVPLARRSCSLPTVREIFLEALKGEERYPYRHLLNVALI
jgi:hypothetical protein